jgi:hypothetical protein
MTITVDTSIHVMACRCQGEELTAVRSHDLEHEALNCWTRAGTAWQQAVNPRKYAHELAKGT